MYIHIKTNYSICVQTYVRTCTHTYSCCKVQAGMYEPCGITVLCFATNLWIELAGLCWLIITAVSVYKIYIS